MSDRPQKELFARRLWSRIRASRMWTYEFARIAWVCSTIVVSSSAILLSFRIVRGTSAKLLGMLLLAITLFWAILTFPQRNPVLSERPTLSSFVRIHIWAELFMTFSLMIFVISPWIPGAWPIIVFPAVYLAHGAVMILVRGKLKREVMKYDGLVCLHCRYPLLGLLPEGCCPECGSFYEAAKTQRIWSQWAKEIW